MRYPVPRPKKPTARGGKGDSGRLTTVWIRDTDIGLYPYQRVMSRSGRIGLLTAHDDALTRLRRPGRRPIPLPASCKTAGARSPRLLAQDDAEHAAGSIVNRTSLRVAVRVRGKRGPKHE